MAADPDIIIVGAGVLGLCTAAELVLRGRAVVIVDPGGPNASSIAAGMIAPGLESVLDGATAERARLMRDARDLWPGFAAATGVALVCEDAEWRGDPDDMAAHLQALGFKARREGDRLFVPGDWRVEVEVAHSTLRAMPGLCVQEDRVVAVSFDSGHWRLELAGGGAASATQLVIATGVGTALPGLPPVETALIQAIAPIKGQLAFVDVPQTGHVVRGAGGYVVPSPGGVLVGATMEFGARDCDWDPTAAEPVVSAGLRLVGMTGARPHLEPRVGVRGATADGLPMAGPAGKPGLHLALAPRRNGWLLGPLVARTVADAIEGKAPGMHAAALDPRRFMGREQTR